MTGLVVWESFVGCLIVVRISLRAQSVGRWRSLISGHGEGVPWDLVPEHSYLLCSTLNVCLNDEMLAVCLAIY